MAYGNSYCMKCVHVYGHVPTYICKLSNLDTTRKIEFLNTSTVVAVQTRGSDSMSYWTT